jgi:hypothetical protein
MRFSKIAASAIASACFFICFAQKGTIGTYSTWDADMTNVEGVQQTGRGVYVAVLDTGLVPNWSDYFPKDRILTSLGTGFDQSVTFTAHSDDGCATEHSAGPLRKTTWIGSNGSTHGTHVTKQHRRSVGLPTPTDIRSWHSTRSEHHPG